MNHGIINLKLNSLSKERIICKYNSLLKSKGVYKDKFTRIKEVVNIRHAFMLYVKDNSDLSDKEIGVLFGNLDQSAVHHARRKIRSLISVQDMETIKLIQEVEIWINSN